MSPHAAIVFLRSIGWVVGTPTDGHPQRAEIKAALAALAHARIDVAKVLADGAPLPAPEPESAEVVALRARVAEVVRAHEGLHAPAPVALVSDEGGDA